MNRDYHTWTGDLEDLKQRHSICTWKHSKCVMSNKAIINTLYCYILWNKSTYI